MSKSRRVVALIVAPLVLVGLWLAYGPSDFSPQADAQQTAEAEEGAGGEQGMQANLDRAAASIVAAAEQGAHEARSEDQLLERTDLSVEALRILGLLGATDTNAQADKLLDHMQEHASPAAAEVIIRMRLGRQLQRWSQLSKADREKSITRFVADIEKEGLTPGHADLLLRLTDNLEMGNQRELAAQAVSALLPAFKGSSEPSLQRRTPVMEGLVRRLDLVGKPLELEGTLLDGSEFDWGEYRGKVVLVDFFANWCGVCREEVPVVMECYRAYRDKGFEVVGVSLDKHPQLANMYRKETGFDFPTLFSAEPRAMEWKSPMAVKYGVTSLPRAILVDQQGNVVDTVARGPRLLNNLQKLLGPPSAAIGGAAPEIGEGPSGELDGQSGVVPAAFEEQASPESEVGETSAPAVPEN
jgi:thiol-disulfide isomerase/thioredoxin